MIGSHAAWVFVALLLGVGVGWLTYKRGRARLVDALIWIIIGLVVAAPILMPDLAAAATPLGTLVALFYFIGCPLGWTWRHGALVEHKCAETDAKGYVFRGAPALPRWQSLGRQREALAARSAPAGSGGTSGLSRAAPVAATAHAVPSDGKDHTPSVTAVTGANAGVTTAPASRVTAPADDTAPAQASAAPTPSERAGAPSAAAAMTRSDEPVARVSTAPTPTSLATNLEDADDTSVAKALSSASTPDARASGSDAAATARHPSTPVAAPPATIPVTTVTPSNPTKDAALGQPIASGWAPASVHDDKPTVATSISSLDGTGAAQSEPLVSTPGQPTQTSLDLSPTSPTGGTSGKIEPEAPSTASAKSDPPASAPVPDQHKHAGVRPPGFVRAREDRPDDLQLIRGIGPQNEGRLHGLGIWHFDQIGGWSAEEVRWVGSYLAFPGRIDREKWVEQAREIASGAIVPKAAARRPTRPR